MMATLLGHAPYVVAAWIFLCGLWGIATSRNFVHLIVCLAVMQTSTYVLLLAIGYRAGGVAPIFTDVPPGARMVDPVTHALMLTDVVVEATVIALLLALAIQVHQQTGTLDPDAPRVRALRG